MLVACPYAYNARAGIDFGLLHYIRAYDLKSISYQASLARYVKYK